jgi:hypothetical protein
MITNPPTRCFLDVETPFDGTTRGCLPNLLQEVSGESVQMMDRISAAKRI